MEHDQLLVFLFAGVGRTPTTAERGLGRDVKNGMLNITDNKGNASKFKVWQ
jgi:hypothetical protein